MLRAKKYKTKYSDCLYLCSIKKKKKKNWRRAAKRKENSNKKRCRFITDFFLVGVCSANSISKTHAAASGIDTDLYHRYLILPLHQGKRKLFKIPTYFEKNKFNV